MNEEKLKEKFEKSDKQMEKLFNFLGAPKVSKDFYSSVTNKMRDKNFRGKPRIIIIAISVIVLVIGWLIAGYLLFKK